MNLKDFYRSAGVFEMDDQDKRDLHKKEELTLVKKIMNKFMNEETDYFGIFIKGVEISLDAARSLQRAIAGETIDKEELFRIKEIKSLGYKHVNESMKAVEEAFITPIDQRDIIEILKGIENIQHSIESVANHLYIMRVAEKDAYMTRFVEIMVSSCERLYDLMVTFRQFKAASTENINRLIVEIDELEKAGDCAYSESMLNIFAVETDAVTILKKKEIYQRFENSLDCFKRVAEMIEKLIAVTM